MKYLSVCSGIEAATQAWHPLGWEPVAFSEIEKFPSAVLSHHYPDVPNWGDMTKFKEWPDETIDLLVGGTPCQSFSVAGLRKGMADPRGNLALTYLAIADRYKPRWLVWENVPGVLSSGQGRDFGSILGAMAELGYGFAYRVLDAQYVRTCRFRRAIPQRRRRVFVVGYLGDWRRAAAVLFDAESMQRNPPPRRTQGQGTTHDVAPSLVSSGRGTERAGDTRGQDPGIAVSLDVADTLTVGADQTFGRPCVIPVAVAGTMLSYANSGGWSNSIDRAAAGYMVPEFTGKATFSAECAPTLNAHFGSKQGLENQYINGGCGLFVTESASAHKGINTTCDEGQTLIPSIYFDCKGSQVQTSEGVSAPLRSMNNDASHANAGGHAAISQAGMKVRRLTPTECERLQGFTDGFTAIPWNRKTPENCPDGPRYKALGNSMAVNVMEWIGGRIDMVEKEINQGRGVRNLIKHAKHQPDARLMDEGDTT